MTPGKCAFVRSDNICLIPPRSWGRIMRELQQDNVSKGTDK